MVDIIEGLSCLDSSTAKVRLIEAVIFAGFVAYAISIAAWPAFHSHKG